MQGLSYGAAALVALLLTTGCGGKIADDGSGLGRTASGSRGVDHDAELGRAGPADDAPEPSHEWPAVRVPSCPVTQPPDGSPCSWDYGNACELKVPGGLGQECRVQCTCFGDSHLNHWTCFDAGCDP